MFQVLVVLFVRLDPGNWAENPQVIPANSANCVPSVSHGDSQAGPKQDKHVDLTH